jgi:hypothetical protein
MAQTTKNDGIDKLVGWPVAAVTIGAWKKTSTTPP